MKTHEKIKYAVCVWGINQDNVMLEDESVGAAGLTFGPATGADYRHTFKACPGTSKENPGGCLHWMSWEEILSQSKKDPKAFEKCLENGCTHDVELTIPYDSLLRGDIPQEVMDDGDGAGVLKRSISQLYQDWNSKNFTTKGWPASRIRATLNGKDEQTDTYIAQGNLFDACLDKETCLLSMLPRELRDGIVPKEVKSDTVYHNVYRNCKTTYDKLWLFSSNELYGESGGTWGTYKSARPNEGSQYQRAKNLEVTVFNYGPLMNYDESGERENWWLRSISQRDSMNAYYVMFDGDLGRLELCFNRGIAFGFCLPGSADNKINDPEPDTTCVKDGIRPYRFSITIGDLSQDGHGKRDVFYVDSNAPVKTVRYAHHRSKEITGIDIHGICDTHGVNKIPDDAMKKAKRLGFRFEKDLLEEDGSMTPLALAKLWVFLLRETDPMLDLQIVDEPKVPSLQGHDEKYGYIGNVGYGLYQ